MADALRLVPALPAAEVEEQYRLMHVLGGLLGQQVKSGRLEGVLWGVSPHSAAIDPGGPLSAVELGDVIRMEAKSGGVSS